MLFLCFVLSPLCSLDLGFCFYFYFYFLIRLDRICFFLVLFRIGVCLRFFLLCAVFLVIFLFLMGFCFACFSEGVLIFECFPLWCLRLGICFVSLVMYCLRSNSLQRVCFAKKGIKINIIWILFNKKPNLQKKMKQGTFQIVVEQNWLLLGKIVGIEVKIVGKCLSQLDKMI